MRNLLVTFHPVTLDAIGAAQQLSSLFDALDQFPDTHLIFTLPNSDTGGRELSRMIHAYVAQRSHASVHASLGQLRYLSCVSLVDGVVGNFKPLRRFDIQPRPALARQYLIYFRSRTMNLRLDAVQRVEYMLMHIRVR